MTQTFRIHQNVLSFFPSDFPGHEERKRREEEELAAQAAAAAANYANTGYDYSSDHTNLQQYAMANGFYTTAPGLQTSSIFCSALFVRKIIDLLWVRINELKKDTIMCAVLGKEVPGLCQKHSVQTLIVCF